MLGQRKTLADAAFPPHKGTSLTDRLYRNDLTVSHAGNRRLRFTDVTAQSQIHSDGYGMGVTVGDYNNDGWVDLYITNFGSNQLYRNNADGTFTDVTDEARVDDRHWLWRMPNAVSSSKPSRIK
jgi:enediyne biosynthesis protein E4